MATTINNCLAVHMPGVNSGVAAGSRTFTTTRQLRVFDLKANETAVVAGAAATLTVANGASTIVTVTTPNPPVINTVYRAGNEVAASTCNDANMLVAVGGTLVFAVSTVDTFNMTAYCYPT